MHLFQRLAGGLLALALTLSFIPAASARQFYTYLLDANCAGEIEAMLEGISNQTFSHTDSAAVQAYVEHFLYDSDFSAIGGGHFPYTNAQGYWGGKTVSDGIYTQVVNATGCLAYSRFVAQVIYGAEGQRRELEESAGCVTGDGLKAFLKKYAQAGEHIRIDGKHSFNYVSGNEEGFYYLDYAGDHNPRIWLRYTTYNNFAARCNELYKPVWLYEADAAENADRPSEPETHWFDEHVLAAEELGLLQSGPSAAYTDSLTLAETVTFAARLHSLYTTGDADIQGEGGPNWYDLYVDYLKEHRILDSELNYRSATTRDQFASLLFAAVPEDMAPESINPAVRFADAADISDSLAVDVLCRAGVLTGISESDGVYFYPDNSITRGEAIALMARLALPEFRVAVD